MQISIIGSGNVAHHLSTALYQNGIDIVQIIARNEKEGKDLASQCGAVSTTSLESILAVDIILIAVSDGAIEEVAGKLPPHIKNRSIIAHTSGTTSIDALRTCTHPGIFYPLQSFSKSTSLDYSGIPFCLHGASTVVQSLSILAKAISTQVHILDDAQRKHLHLAAVMANNFTNHIYHIATSYLAEHRLPDDILTPLIQETVRKLDVMSPYDAQTGPARRKDYKTIEQHLEKLDVGSARYDIYSILTKSIIHTYHENNR